MARRIRKRRDVEKERFWRGVIERQHTSGLYVRAFCRRDAISEPSFYSWKRTIRERDVERGPRTATEQTARSLHSAAVARAITTPPREAFVPVSLVESPPACAPTPAVIEIVVPGGYAVRVAAGCDADVLRCALTVLQSAAPPRAAPEPPSC